MERMDEINRKMFILKKRFRADEMKEIFQNTPNKSVIEIYENVHKNKNENKGGKKSFFSNLGGGGFVTIKAKAGEDAKIEEKNREGAENKINRPQDISSNGSSSSNYNSQNQQNTQNTQNTQNNQNNQNNLHCLIDQRLPQSSSEKKKTSTTSTGSGKSSSKKKNEKSVDKKPISKKKSPKITVKPLPPDNLLFQDQRQNLEKNSINKPYIKNKSDKNGVIPGANSSSLSSNLNMNVSSGVSSGSILPSTNNGVNSTNKPPISNSSTSNNAIPKENTTNPNEIKTQSNVISSNSAPILPSSYQSEKLEDPLHLSQMNENEDDYFEEKEELFNHTLPPEVMGGTPEYEKDEDVEMDKGGKENSKFTKKINFSENNSRERFNTDSENKEGENYRDNDVVPDKEEEDNQDQMIVDDIYNNKLSSNKLNIILPNPNLILPNTNTDNSTLLTLTKKESGTRIMLPNTYNNEVVLKTNSSSQSLLGKNKIQHKGKPKIIDDEDEELTNINGGEKENGRHSYDEEDRVSRASNSNSGTQGGTKIKIMIPEGGNIFSPPNLKSNEKERIGIQEKYEKSTERNSSISQIRNTKYDKVEIDKSRLNQSVRNLIQDNSAQRKNVNKLNNTSGAVNSSLSNPPNNSNNLISTSTTNSIPIKSSKIPANDTKSKTFNKIKESMLSMTEINKSSNINTTTNSATNSNQNKVKVASNISIEEPIEIEKVDDSKYFLKNFISFLDKIKEKYMNKKSSDVESLAEFEGIVTSINQLNNADFSKNEFSIIERIIKNIVKLIGILSKIDQLEQNSYQEIIEIIDSTTYYLKKFLQKQEISPNKTLKPVKIIFKFVSSVLRFKNHKSAKIKNLYKELKSLQTEKKISDTKSISNQLLTFTKDSQDFISNQEKINKLIKEIIVEEDRQSKSKKHKSSDFQKTIDKMRKVTRTTAHYLSLSDCSKVVKTLYDLINTYLKDN